ncbi:MAG: hypothetical protein IKN77_00950 [Paludibacteraceae bacterium]|nr:hypothetical protein [Paludibacteraceae bacterium]
MSRKYKKTYQTTQNLGESSPSVQNKTSDEDLESPVGFVKFLLCGPKKENPKPLTFGVCLRRFFTVLDNLIAAALLYYVLTWIKFYSNGADTSFNVIIDDMSTLCYKNAIGLFFIIVATWRFLYYSDSLPCLKNFTYPMPYLYSIGLIVVLSLGNFAVWLRLLAAHGFDIDSISQPVGDETWYKDNVSDYLPFWAQEIRIVILGVVFMIRRFLLNDTDMDF